MKIKIFSLFNANNVFFSFFLGAMVGPIQKIVGGSLAYPGEFPHAVSLRISGQHFCGGSIVGPQHIVTAAHCIQGAMVWYLMNSGLTVVSGTNSLSRGGNSHKVKKITPHPDFKFDVKKYFPNDIAVITVRKIIHSNIYSLQLGNRRCQSNMPQLYMSYFPGGTENSTWCKILNLEPCLTQNGKN